MDELSNISKEGNTPPLNPLINHNSSNTSKEKKPSIEEQTILQSSFKKTLEDLKKMEQEESGMTKFRDKVSHLRLNLVRSEIDHSDYLSSRQNLNIKDKIQLLKVNRSPKASNAPSICSDKRIQGNKKVHFIVENKLEKESTCEELKLSLIHI